MQIGTLTLSDDGLWSSAVHPGRVDVLLGALDPDVAYVLIETWDGQTDWHEVPVSLGPDEASCLRIVRRHRFDLLVSPQDAIAIDRSFGARGPVGGGLRCFQFRDRPSADFGLPDRSQSRADAMRGRGVELTIDLPHEGEVAVVSSPSRSALESYVGRLG